MATLFIVANTIRLVLYSRRDEIEIMRLVGATDRFIKIPFYLEGMIQGGVGHPHRTGPALCRLFGFALHFAPGLASGMIQLRFFTASACAAAILGGTLIGWLGCWVSLKQFMK